MIYKKFELKVGQKVYGTVINIKPYGAFVKIEKRCSRAIAHRRYICCKNEIARGKTTYWSKNTSDSQISGYERK